MYVCLSTSAIFFRGQVHYSPLYFHPGLYISSAWKVWYKHLLNEIQFPYIRSREEIVANTLKMTLKLYQL